MAAALSLTPLGLAPLDLPGGAGDVGEHAGEVHGFLEPLLGLGLTAVILAALIVAYVVLSRRGLIPTIALPRVATRRDRPEDAARQILSERFAHGDLSTEEFMERASALNWTPGIESSRTPPLGRG